MCKCLACVLAPCKVSKLRGMAAPDAQEWLASGNPGPTARNFLTEPTLRRLSRIPLDDEIDAGVL